MGVCRQENAEAPACPPHTAGLPRAPGCQPRAPPSHRQRAPWRPAPGTGQGAEVSLPAAISAEPEAAGAGLDEGERSQQQPGIPVPLCEQGAGAPSSQTHTCTHIPLDPHPQPPDGSTRRWVCSLWLQEQLEAEKNVLTLMPFEKPGFISDYPASHLGWAQWEKPDQRK